MLVTAAQLLPVGWNRLPVHLVQIDSGLTQSTWGINARNTPFMLELDNVLTRVNGTLHHVSAGQSGIWGIGLLGNIFLRTGISEENPRGNIVITFAIMYILFTLCVTAKERGMNFIVLRGTN